MLVFQSLRAAAVARGVADAEAFLAGFQGAFRIAACLPVLVVAAAFVRGWGRG